MEYWNAITEYFKFFFGLSEVKLVMGVLVVFIFFAEGRRLTEKNMLMRIIISAIVSAVVVMLSAVSYLITGSLSGVIESWSASLEELGSLFPFLFVALPLLYSGAIKFMVGLARVVINNFR